MSIFYCICDDDCRYETMTKEQILTAIEEALEQGHVSDPDGAVFSKIKEIRANEAVQIWVGTEAEYNAISPVPTSGLSLVRVGADGVLYICTNDTTLDRILSFEVADEVTEDGTNAVSGAAVAAYMAGYEVKVDSTVTASGTNPVSGAAVAAYAQPVLVKKAVGDGAIAVEGTAEHSFVGLRIYGKTTQNGTPSFDAPVELVNAGEGGSIGVTIEGGEADAVQTITLSTPNGLPGIPVASGGNYTDANGQQWLCDEIDLARGVYIQRVGIYEATDAKVWMKNGSASILDGLHVYQLNYSLIPNYLRDSKKGLSSHAVLGGWGKEDNTVYFGGSLTFTTAAYSSLDDWHAFVGAQYAAGTPITVVYCLAEPVETPLTAEEIAAFKALRTHKPNTTVLNDSGAGMEVKCMSVDAEDFYNAITDYEGVAF